MLCFSQFYLDEYIYVHSVSACSQHIFTTVSQRDAICFPVGTHTFKIDTLKHNHQDLQVYSDPRKKSWRKIGQKALNPMHAELVVLQCEYSVLELTHRWDGIGWREMEGGEKRD